MMSEPHPAPSTRRAPRITLVAALAANGVIGAGGRMPWHLPADLRHFKAVTMGHPLVMGRKTAEALGRPLAGRDNLVLTRHSASLPGGFEPVPSLAVALQRAATLPGGDEIMVIGGGEIYRLVLPLAARLVLTLIDARIAGDTYFPPWSESEWREVSSVERPADAEQPWNLRFVTYERRQ